MRDPTGQWSQVAKTFDHEKEVQMWVARMAVRYNGEMEHAGDMTVAEYLNEWFGEFRGDLVWSSRRDGVGVKHRCEQSVNSGLYQCD